MRLLPAVLAALALVGCTPQSPDTDARPNFILILTDDQGYGDVGVHDNPDIRTPNIDRFAREGTELTRFYVEPVCAPTRASLMTGRSFYRSGVIHTSRGGAKMHGDEITLAERLGDAGYRTGIFGKWHLGDNYPMRPIDQGFQEALWHKSGGIGQSPDVPNDYFDPFLWRNDQRVQGNGYCTDLFFEAAMAFIEDNRDQPFFVYLPTNAPHTPLTVAEKYWKPYADAGLDETTARVYGMVENLDENLGRLLDQLERLRLRENTFVVFLSDNGPQQVRYSAGLRGQKTMNYEGGVRALSFWQWPAAGWEAGRKIDRPAAHIDVAPTFLDAAGLEPPADRPFDGWSLLPLLAGGAPGPERTIFLQVARGLEPKPYQNAAAVADRWKLVLSPGTFNEEDWAGPPAFELYDLTADPGEQQDVAREHPQEVAALREQYDDWFASVGASRDFEPGVIVIGSDEENPAVLCRYQDSTFVDGKPTTWTVEIAQAGEYELTVNRGDRSGAGTLWVEVNGERTSRPLAAGESAAVVDLPAGPAKLDIWTQEEGKERVVETANNSIGDVVVRRLP